MSFDYVAAGQQIAEVNALGDRTSMVYDAVGRQIAVQDVRGNCTSSVYDARGSLITTIDPLNRRTSYAYNAVAAQTLRVDARGIATSYSYDPRNLLSGVQYPDGSFITNSYDALGQLTVMADNTGITTYSYDGDNRQSTVAYPVGKVLSYSYDGAGNRTKLQQGDNVTNYSHNPNNNLTQIMNPYNETTTFSYDALDREKQKTLANGVTINHTYDAAGRKVLLEQRKADTTALAIYTATYDAVGMQTSTPELDGSVNDYSYDATYQLTNETRCGSNAFSTTFTYDPTGNRLMQNADGTLTTSTYDAANQLLTATANSDITSFTYDANGNQTVENANSALTTYTWDAENRMAGADDGTSTETFTYAGDGQRRKKSTSSGDINYLLDEENILEELDGNDGLIAHYTDFPGYWGGLSSLALPTGAFTQVAGMGAFNAVQFNQANFNQNETTIEVESHFYLFDLQSSNRLLLDTNAAKDNEYLYKAFGEKVLSTGTIRNPFQFQGQVGPYFDANNRTWMRARIYNPITGRWESPDPIGFAGRDWNLFRFVGNNAINGVDPLGLYSKRELFDAWFCYYRNFYAYTNQEICCLTNRRVKSHFNCENPNIDKITCPEINNQRLPPRPPTTRHKSKSVPKIVQILMFILAYILPDPSGTASGLADTAASRATLCTATIREIENDIQKNCKTAYENDVSDPQAKYCTTLFSRLEAWKEWCAKGNPKD